MSSDSDQRDAVADPIRDLTGALGNGFERFLHGPELEAKAALAMGPAAVLMLLSRRAARTVELETVVSEQAAELEEIREVLERLRLDHDQERKRFTSDQQRLTAERDRLAAELRAIRRARGELPRTGNDLRKWREERGLTQVEAAEMLGVGHATVERAEGTRAAERLLGRGLRTALERDAATTRVVIQAGPPSSLRPGTSARKDSERRAR